MALQKDQILSLLRCYLEEEDLDTFGFGFDPGTGSEYEKVAAHQPMAYALFTSAFSKLYCATSEKKHLERAIGCYERLKSLSSTKPHMSWGLPFPWKASKAWHPYAITTALGGEGALDLFYATRDQRLLEDLSNISEWLTIDLPWHQYSQKTACPWYAPDWPIVCINIAAKVGSFLLRAGSALDDRALMRKGRCAIQFVLREQRVKGWWPYSLAPEESSRPDRRVDCIHTAYVLESLLDYQQSLPFWSALLQLGLRRAIARGAHFFASHFLVDGFLRERVVLMTSEELEALGKKKPESKDWTRAAISDKESFLLFPEETRGWGYGAALAFYGKLIYARVLEEKPLSDILTYIKNRLQSPEGRYQYKATDARCYVRHEAHIVNGLATLLGSLR